MAGERYTFRWGKEEARVRFFEYWRRRTLIDLAEGERIDKAFREFRSYFEYDAHTLPVRDVPHDPGIKEHWIEPLRFLFEIDPQQHKVIVWDIGPP